MDTLPKHVQEMVLSGVSNVKTGYFFKNAKMDDTELPVYKNETLYITPEELVWAILEQAIEDEFNVLCEQRDESNEHITPTVDEEEYKSILEDIMTKVKNCKDALSVCDTVKNCLSDYDKTCEMFLDIAYTSVFN